MARPNRGRVARSPGKQRRLDRRRAERERLAEIYWEDEGRIVCDRCGLEQAFRSSPHGDEIAPCEGPLGLHCDGVTATSIEAYLDADTHLRGEGRPMHALPR
jgi:hypothetical protein